MSRDYDDDFDRRDRDDRDRDDRDRDDRDRGRDDRDGGGDDIAEAKRKTSTPGMLLAISAGLSLLLVVAGLVVAFTNPNLMIDAMQKNFIDPLPAGPQKDQQQAQFEQQKPQMRLDNPVDVSVRGIALVLNLLALIAGIKMRGVSGYGLCMTGAIAAIIPVSGCCFLTLPMGIWAVVVLVNPVVKAGFAARSGKPVRRPDADDDRWGSRDDRRDDR